MLHFENKSRYDLYDLEKLIALLRHPGGCPWDAEQTHESLRRNMLEEAYEAVEAIDEGDPDHLREELGDVLTQVVFHAGIEQDEGRFCLDDVADAVCRKLIFRHPHVFGSEDIRTSDGVLAMWDEIKKVEKKQDSVTDTLRSVAKSLPALWRAEKLQKKAAKAVDAPPMDVWDAMDILADRMIGLSDAVSGEKDAEQAFGDVPTGRDRSGTRSHRKQRPFYGTVCGDGKGRGRCAAYRRTGKRPVWKNGRRSGGSLTPMCDRQPAAAK